MEDQVTKVIQRLCNHKNCCWHAVQRVTPEEYYNTKDNTLYSLKEEHRYICTFCGAILDRLYRDERTSWRRYDWDAKYETEGPGY